MKMSRLVTLGVLFMVCIALPNKNLSQNISDFENLAGFDTLTVRVGLNSVALQSGLTEKQIQTDVEVKLRQAKIKVFDNDKIFTPRVILFISIAYLDSGCETLAGNITTSVYQEVSLNRNKSISLLAKTWESSFTTSIPKNQVQAIRRFLSDQIDEFINDYLKANGSTSSQSIKPPAYTPAPEKQDDSPFTATYVGGNSPPTVEVFNDTDRTMYFDFGQGKITAYTILSQTSQKITISEGLYNYKASAPRVRSKEGEAVFKKGYVYSWRFFIVTVPR